jgi:hypothetical protein
LSEEYCGEMAMDGLSRWDFVLWIVVAYFAVMAMVRLMLAYQRTTVRKLSDQLPAQTPSKNATPASNSQREAA